MRQKVFQHIIGWALFLGYDYYQFFSRGDVDFSSIMIVSSTRLMLIVAFYFTYLFISPRLLKSFTFLKGILAAVIGIFVFIIGRYLIEEVLYDLVFGFTNYYVKSIPYYIYDNLLRGFIPVMAGMLVFLLEKKTETTRDQLKLQEEKKTAELAFLRTQMNPHFLFNTLSFLHTEAYLVNPKLADTILQLSDVLRYSVESSKGAQVTIQSEIDLLENYIGIFEKRFENKCFIDFKKEGKEFDQKIEPLLLIPFLENAIKHGVVSDAQHPIKLSVEVDPGRLRFECENKVNRQTKDPGSGIGIENIKKRLNLLYPEKHSLIIENQGGILFTIKLEIHL